MTLKVNVNGTWKEATAVQVNVGGEWKTADAIQTNVNGEWKDSFIASNTPLAQAIAIGYDLDLSLRSSNSGVSWQPFSIISGLSSGGNLIENVNQRYFVTGAGDRTPLLSLNGTDWTLLNLSSRVEKIIYTGSNYLAFGNNGTGRVFRSTDGISWTEISNGAYNISANFYACHGNNITLLAGNNSNKYYTSTDNGSNWTERQLPFPANAGSSGLVFDNINNIFVMISGGYTGYKYSSDGINWTSVNLGYTPYRLDFINGKTIFYSSSSNIIKYSNNPSTGGSLLESASLPSSLSDQRMAYAGNKYIVFNRNNYNSAVYISTDLSSWTTVTLPSSREIRSIASV